MIDIPAILTTSTTTIVTIIRMLISKVEQCNEQRCTRESTCLKDLLRGGVRCQCQLGTSGPMCNKSRSNNIRYID